MRIHLRPLIVASTANVLAILAQVPELAKTRVANGLMHWSDKMRSHAEPPRRSLDVNVIGDDNGAGLTQDVELLRRFVEA